MDEERVRAQVSSLCRRTKRTLYVWDHADHFEVVGDSRAPAPKAADPMAILRVVPELPTSITSSGACSRPEVPFISQSCPDVSI